MTKQLTFLSQETLLQTVETDPLLRLIGSLNVDIPDLAENCDLYISQDLYQELKYEYIQGKD